MAESKFMREKAYKTVPALPRIPAVFHSHLSFVLFSIFVENYHFMKNSVGKREYEDNLLAAHHERHFSLLKWPKNWSKRPLSFKKNNNSAVIMVSLLCLLYFLNELAILAGRKVDF